MPAILLAASLLSPCGPLPPSLPRGGRPSLSGPEELLQADAFVIHWTRQGIDAPPLEDSDGDGVVDYVERIAASLDGARQAYLDAGWDPVRPDPSGDPRLDLYVSEIDAFGYAWVVPTDETSSCWMQIDPAIAGLGDSGLESVVAHELHHCVQFGYQPYAEHRWIYEATATWWQYLLHSDDTLQLALDVLWSQRLRGGDLALTHEGDRFEYAGFAVMKYWLERGGGDRGRLEALWRALGERPDGVEALQREALRLWDEPLGGALLEHMTWNRFACARDDGAHYDHDLHPCELPAVQVDPVLLEPDAGDFEVELAPGPFTAAHVDLPAQGERPPVIQCEVPVDAVVRLGLASVDAQGRRGESAAGLATDGVALELAADPEGVTAIVLLSESPDAVAVRCTVQRVDPQPEPGEAGCDCGSTNVAWLLILPWWRRRRPEDRPRRRDAGVRGPC